MTHADPYLLTEQQRSFLDTFGYLHLPGLLSDRFDDIERAFEELMASRGGDAHVGAERFCVAPFLNFSEYLCTLLDDPRLDGIARCVCGDDYQYWNSDGNYYVGDTRWHSDGAWQEPIGYYKLAIYLDPVDADTGALRVVPGSHRFGERFADEVEREIDQKTFWGGVAPNEVPAVALTSAPGDLVLFHQILKHAAFGGGNRRRMFTINYTPAIDAAREAVYRETVSSHDYTVADVFGQPPGPLLTGAPPSRLPHLEALRRYIPDSAH